MATVTMEPVQTAEKRPVVEGGLYRFTLEQVYRMVREGIIPESNRTVLLDGLLVEKMTKHPPHVVATKLAHEALRPIVPAGWHVGKEDPVAIIAGPGGHDSAPEPDLMILRGAIRDYSTRPPGPGDVALVVEVADSSLPKDRKGPARYAWARIPAAWIVNLNGRAIEVYTDPSGPCDDPRYLTARTFKEAEEVPVVLDDREVGRIAVREVLP